MDEIVFKARWREELEAISMQGKLIFEFTVGEKHVYFPTETRWKVCVPLWAAGKWADYLNGCKNWCSDNRIPLSLVEDAQVYEEKNIG